jgi:hypothetical protein
VVGYYHTKVQSDKNQFRLFHSIVGSAVFRILSNNTDVPRHNKISTVRIGQNDVPIGEAVAMLLTEFHTLQTKYVEFSGRINELLGQNAALNQTIAIHNARH